MPVGVLEDASWERGAIQMEPGDWLIIYTDGLTEAQNTAGEYFGENGLRASLHSLREKTIGEPPSASGILAGLLEEIHTFVGDTPLGDDLTVVVLSRDLIT
jgi:sigma-B regulation protein RsbU (phosphoserine phosphatase)